MIGGMLLSTAIGIIFIPVTFSVVEYLSHRFVQGRQGHHHGLESRLRSGARAKLPGGGPQTPTREVRHEEFTTRL